MNFVSFIKKNNKVLFNLVSNFFFEVRTLTTTFYARNYFALLVNGAERYIEKKEKAEMMRERER